MCQRFAGQGKRAREACYAAVLARLLCARRQVMLVRQRRHVDAKGAVTFSQN
jgi:hypothetical protein